MGHIPRDQRFPPRRAGEHGRLAERLFSLGCIAHTDGRAVLQPYYDSLYELFSQDWKVEFAKTDCWDSARKAELTVQANAVHKQPLTAGIVNGSAKPRAFALSLSGPMFHGAADTDPSFWSRTQAATMYGTLL